MGEGGQRHELAPPTDGGMRHELALLALRFLYQRGLRASAATRVTGPR